MAKNYKANRSTKDQGSKRSGATGHNSTSKTKKGYRNNNRKSPSNQESKDNTLESKETAVSYANNPFDFMPESERALLNSITGFSFPRVLGRTYDINTLRIAIPTASRIYVNPALGSMTEANAATAPVNQAAKNVYVLLASVNNKETKYQPGDVMLLILAMGSILDLVGYIRRAMAFTFVGSSSNVAFPKGMFTAMGVDYADYKDKIPMYRDRFNSILTQINAITFPYDIGYLRKCTTRYTKCFKDSMTDSYGIHFPVPHYLWKINDLYSDQGGGLDSTEIVPSSAGVKTMQQYLDILQDMVETLRSSATFNVIYSDLLNVYYRSSYNRITIPLFAISEVVEPEYNPMFNIMLRHARLTGAPQHIAEFDSSSEYNLSAGNDVKLLAGKNLVWYKPEFLVTDNFTTYDNFVNFFETNYPDDVTRFEMTRWMWQTKEIKTTADETEHYAYDNILQDSYIEQIRLYQADAAVGAKTAPITRATSGSFNSVVAIVNLWQKMANLPHFYQYTSLNELPQYEQITDIVRVLSDVDAFSSVDVVYLEGIANQTLQHYFGSAMLKF